MLLFPFEVASYLVLQLLSYLVYLLNFNKNLLYIAVNKAFNMQTKTDKLLAVMHVLAWITFIGLMVKGGAFLFSYVITTINPEAARNLYSGLDFYNLRQYHFWHYSANLSLLVSLLVLEAYIAFLVVQVLSKIKLTNPFTTEMANLLQRMSHFILGAWVLAVLYNGHTKWLAKRVDGLEVNLISSEALFLAGVVFIIAQVFKKGVELQTENELTV